MWSTHTALYIKCVSTLWKHLSVAKKKKNTETLIIMDNCVAPFFSGNQGQVVPTVLLVFFLFCLICGLILWKEPSTRKNATQSKYNWTNAHFQWKSCTIFTIWSIMWWPLYLHFFFFFFIKCNSLSKNKLSEMENA